MLMIRPLLAALVAALVVSAAGCGSSNLKPTEPSVASTTPSGPSGATTAAQAPSRPKPAVSKGSGPPPKQLVVKDLIPGTGPAAQTGQNVTVNYVGVLYSSGKQFDASYDRGQPFSFPLGQGQVIPGWDHGLVGMKVGGRRELIIPADQAYGAQGQPPTIGPNQALIFVIDLLSTG